MNIGELFLNVVGEFYENDSRAGTFGTDTELHHCEIHMLQNIAENPELHISGLARLMGVTRGAASQTANRLERKGMVFRDASPDDHKKVMLRLTSKGKTAVASHKSAHKKYDAVIDEILADADDGQRRFLANFLLDFEQSIKNG